MVFFGQFCDIFWYFGNILTIFWPKMGIFWKKNFLKNMDENDMTPIFYQYNIDENDMTSIFTNTISTIPIWPRDHIGSDQYKTNTKKMGKKWTTLAMTIASRVYCAELCSGGSFLSMAVQSWNFALCLLIHNETKKTYSN